MWMHEHPFPIRNFAWLREQIKTLQQEQSLPPGVTTAGELMIRLVEMSPAHAAAAFSN
jgi:hypothetical protein